MSADAGGAIRRAIGCTILAAGASRRLGHPKQLVTVDGAPLLRRIAAAACQSACARVAVVLGAHADRVAPALDGLPVDRLPNPAWPEGMASSVRVAVTWAERRQLDALLLATCDQDALDARHLNLLVAASAGGRRVAASAYDGVLGVPALFPRPFYRRLAALAGDAGARAILRDPAVQVAAIGWAPGARDVDTPEDAAALALPGATELASS